MAQLPASALTASVDWRAGKPIEDPDKMKRWGFVTAKPSEFLVHVRGGRVLSRSSGQGASCFKWPWDAVSVVPTSLQRLAFRADQVTAEKVGVEVVGLAVYRIAEPLLAYRVLNFSYPERAQQKLEETLTSMFVGAARRLIANLTVEDCLQKRKGAIASELLREIAPVVGGQGSLDDATAQGWGVVIDTIEIQEVRVLSEQLFAAMQAPFRAQLDRSAREARALAERDVASREAACRQAIEEAKISSEVAIRDRRAELARSATEQQARDAIRAAALSSEQQQAKNEAEHAVQEARIVTDTKLQERYAQAEIAREEARLHAALRKLELGALEADAEQAVGDRRFKAFEAKAALARAEAELEAQLKNAQVDVDLKRDTALVDIELRRAEVSKVAAEAQARVLLAERLPDVASAMGGKIGEMKVVQYGATTGPFESIVQAIHAVMDLAQPTG